jgi:adenylate cyclase
MSGRTAGDGSRDPIGRLVDLGEPTLDNEQVSRLAGADRDVADRLWRALGFPDVPEGQLAFTDQDVRALRLATEGLEQLKGEQRERALDAMLHETRIIGASLANLAESELEAIGVLAELGLRRRLLTQAVDLGLENSDFGWLILYALRRQLAAAVRRHARSSEGTGQPRQTLAVGFVDLVGFTGLSHQLEAEELGQMIGRFESLAFDVVTESGGRVVKLIGDEAMLVCPEARQAVVASLKIIDSTGAANIPPARAGVALGDVLAQGGDYFGDPVNLASRIVERAPPGAVIIDEQAASSVRSENGLALEPIRRSPLKGIGVVPLWRAIPSP